MISLIGSKRNMGRRYHSIMNYYEIKHDCYDKHNIKDISSNYHKYDKAIIATPTDNHVEMIKKLAGNIKTILCEKPVVKSMEGLAIVENLCADYEIDLYMVNNYEFAHGIRHSPSKWTKYNYYNSGNDGIYWDCIQLIYMANDRITLSNDSPEWICKINGIKISRASIDCSYVNMILDFWGNEDNALWGRREIREATKKVLKYAKDHNRDTSKKQ